MYDGLNAPQMVRDINIGEGNSNPAYLTVYNDKLYFQATDSSTGTELWTHYEEISR